MQVVLLTLEVWSMMRSWRARSSRSQSEVEVGRFEVWAEKRRGRRRSVYLTDGHTTIGMGMEEH